MAASLTTIISPGWCGGCYAHIATLTLTSVLILMSARGRTISTIRRRSDYKFLILQDSKFVAKSRLRQIFLGGIVGSLILHPPCGLGARLDRTPMGKEHVRGQYSSRLVSVGGSRANHVTVICGCGSSSSMRATAWSLERARVPHPEMISPLWLRPTQRPVALAPFCMRAKNNVPVGWTGAYSSLQLPV